MLSLYLTVANAPISQKFRNIIKDTLLEAIIVGGFVGMRCVQIMS